MKENTKDILFMVWGFIGGGLCFNLILFSGLGYLNSCHLLKLIALRIGSTINLLGFLFVGFLIFILGLRKIIKIYKQKHGRKI